MDIEKFINENTMLNEVHTQLFSKSRLIQLLDKYTQALQLQQTGVSSSVLVDNNLIGNELYYRSEITKCYTKFKVKTVVLNTEIISKSVCFSVDLISENNNKYTYEEDFIFSAVL